MVGGKILGCLVLAAITAAGGCTSSSGAAHKKAPATVWYKWGKTIEEADDDCRQCYYEAAKYARQNRAGYISGYAPEEGPYGDYRDSYAMAGHGTGERLAGNDADRYASPGRPMSYEGLRDRQVDRCMKEKGYRRRDAGSIGGDLVKMEVPVAGEHWVAGIPAADANSADPNERPEEESVQ
jgi:hypothetical protein